MKQEFRHRKGNADRVHRKFLQNSANKKEQIMSYVDMTKEDLVEQMALAEERRLLPEEFKYTPVEVIPTEGMRETARTMLKVVFEKIDKVARCGDRHCWSEGVVLKDSMKGNINEI